MQKLRIESGRYYIGETELITVPQSKKHGRCVGCYAQHHACSAMGMREVCSGSGVIFVEKKVAAWWIVWLIAGLSGLFAWIVG